MEFKIRKERVPAGALPGAGHRRSQEHDAHARQRPPAHEGKNQLLCGATDLNVSLTAELKSKNENEGGLTVGAKNLYEIIATLPATRSRSRRPTTTGPRSAAARSSSIVGMPDRDFPKVPTIARRRLRRSSGGAPGDDRASCSRSATTRRAST